MIFDDAKLLSSILITAFVLSVFGLCFLQSCFSFVVESGNRCVYCDLISHMKAGPAVYGNIQSMITSLGLCACIGNLRSRIVPSMRASRLHVSISHGDIGHHPFTLNSLREKGAECQSERGRRNTEPSAPGNTAQAPSAKHVMRLLLVGGTCHLGGNPADATEKANHTWTKSHSLAPTTLALHCLSASFACFI